MRTIESFEDYVEPIHEALNNVFLPTIFGNDSPFSEELCFLHHSKNESKSPFALSALIHLKIHQIIWCNTGIIFYLFLH